MFFSFRTPHFRRSGRSVAKPEFRIRPLPFLAALLLLAAPAVSRADDKAPVLRAIATADETEVHPDSVFDVTLSLENETDTVQTIHIPDPAWDKVWRSSNRHVTWDFWDTDDNNTIAVEIEPHGSYTFPKPLKMYVDGNVRAKLFTISNIAASRPRPSGRRSGAVR